MKRYQGIYTALLTPFDGNGKVNEGVLRALVAHNLSLGVTGFYVCGSTAEALMLSKEERMHIMRTVAEAAKGAKLIAHVGSLCERDAHALADYANELSYDMISSVAPFYYKFTRGEIKDYYFRLAEGSDAPMLVYHFPAFSGVAMSEGEIAAFLQSDRFAGIKFTSNDFFTLERCRTKFPDKLIFNGYDEMMLSGLAMGADGGIGSTYNFMADKFVLIRKLFLEGRTIEARAVQNEANRIISILCRIGVMQAEKEILNQLGLDFGACLPPFGKVSEEDKALLRKEIIPFVRGIS